MQVQKLYDIKKSEKKEQRIFSSPQATGFLFLLQKG